jgi:lipid II:glycine glycyltransferase (peptidoglycan interpeptide bridge formation enzyme)
MSINLIDPINDDKWNDFVINHPKSNFFHQSCWAEIIYKTFNYSPKYFAVSSGNEIKAAIPFFEVRSSLTGNRFVSIPFSDYSPLLVQEEDHLRELLMVSAKSLREQNCTYMEIRAGEDVMDLQNIPLNPGPLQKAELYKLHVTPLSEDVESTYKTLDGKRVRWAINRSKRDGIKIEMDNSPEFYKKFYSMYLSTRNKLGVPGQPWIFFKLIFKSIIQNGKGFILKASKGDDTLGASLFVVFKDTVMLKYNVSVEKFLKYQFVEALIWEGMHWGCINGYKKFDHGRTAINNQGLLSLKKRLGSEILNLPYYFYPEAKGVGSIAESSMLYKIAKTFFKRAPSQISHPVGNLLIKHLA